MPETGFTDSLAEDFWSVARRLRHLSVESLAPWDIAPSHARALSIIANDPIRLSALAERLHVAARSVTEVVDALAERGVVERRPDPDDRRATLVALTEQGREIATAIKQARTQHAKEFFGALSASDRAELSRLLRLLASG